MTCPLHATHGDDSELPRRIDSLHVLQAQHVAHRTRLNSGRLLWRRQQEFGRAGNQMNALDGTDHMLADRGPGDTRASCNRTSHRCEPTGRALRRHGTTPSAYPRRTSADRRCNRTRTPVPWRRLRSCCATASACYRSEPRRYRTREEAREAYRADVCGGLPPHGQARLLWLTDRQAGKMEVYFGQKRAGREFASPAYALSAGDLRATERI